MNFALKPVPGAGLAPFPLESSVQLRHNPGDE
jgi:hypothetical protein